MSRILLFTVSNTMLLLFLMTAHSTIDCLMLRMVPIKNRAFNCHSIKRGKALYMFNMPSDDDSKEEDMSMKYIQPDAAPSELTTDSTNSKPKFPVDIGKVISFGLYGYIGYLLIDTVRIFLQHRQ